MGQTAEPEENKENMEIPDSASTETGNDTTQAETEADKADEPTKMTRRQRKLRPARLILRQLKLRPTRLMRRQLKLRPTSLILRQPQL